MSSPPSVHREAVVRGTDPATPTANIKHMTQLREVSVTLPLPQFCHAHEILKSSSVRRPK